jgi:hypothetical protein
MTAIFSPGLTTCSAFTPISVTLPPTGARIGFSIFMDSNMQMVSPSFTASPTLTLTLIIFPVMGASIISLANCRLLG